MKRSKSELLLFPEKFWKSLDRTFEKRAKEKGCSKYVLGLSINKKTGKMKWNI